MVRIVGAAVAVNVSRGRGHDASDGGTDLRRSLVAAVAIDQLGPYVPDEVLRPPPSRWYLIGFLVPKTVRDSDDRDPTDDDEMAAGNDETCRRPAGRDGGGDGVGRPRQARRRGRPPGSPWRGARAL